ncbi:MAG: DUF2306 domain-containing protein [Proteobacteria bacterium]|nr:DUF2306 domain-containing protein [Pseudomonadota bacterium]
MNTAIAVKRPIWRMIVPGAVALGIVGIALIPAFLRRGGEGIPFHPHAPAWGLWSHLGSGVQWHVVAASMATVIGFVVVSLPKGSPLHKILGWTWVASMALTAVSSFFITGLNGDRYSIIHILSGWTMVALPLGIYAIKRRNIAEHRRAMTGLFFGGLLVAGALTFIPGRFMYQLFFG